MVESKEFLKSILDTISKHIVVIDEKGDIQFVNRSWQTFGDENNCQCNTQWEEQNYLAICQSAAQQGDEFGAQALSGISQVINQQLTEYYLEYPCHSNTDKRWFLMRAVPFEHASKRFIVISHINITERKIAEQQVQELARIDGLTLIANRRHFDDFYKQEWSRCARLKHPLSLAMIDLDNFKSLNDNFGHLVGDICLKEVAKLLPDYTRRPGDLCARYGGEEFVLVLGNTQSHQAQKLVTRFMAALNTLQLPELAGHPLTVSIGLATIYPSSIDDAMLLIEMADNALYQAKEAGRNQLVIADNIEPLNLEQCP
ncbi:sensor domain-containing diguanylate cyclase [Pseudoalteromonas sp. B5MOD-1]|uniref:sensor domain-containing diguanylate cyclase n=1 Tax=Pseudoalteromonas TaxID=53246 RepID=UPI0007861179|nr:MULTISPECIES: sensor domain-containing diguanylate cyclase [Pseudoalteromonas]MCO7205697.1 sensor domain-containing diguanylate cyclase [Pseudoalteromonas sp. CnMc7-37]MCZ4250581.1 sensor domain-containing diguanylate cyclase [Pseudoalteromonas shioyasakiensis]RZF85473.1 diguanylate cyclase [Pseudoalteromonas sp. CO109Y]TMO32711.1 GGDEF domain-containing protein [Pseudoalteromonas sp. S4491]TMO35789.1 GGDEF domain-containing protein [Pseudoalteromonas sp. S4488]